MAWPYVAAAPERRPLEFRKATSRCGTGFLRFAQPPIGVSAPWLARCCENRACLICGRLRQKPNSSMNTFFRILPLVSCAAALHGETAGDFKKIQLSDQFWAEGANFGDFNKDGKMDVVSGP